MTPKQQMVLDHIKASYPCSALSVNFWCAVQGLEEEFSPALGAMLVAGEVTLDPEHDGGRTYFVINPT